MCKVMHKNGLRRARGYPRSKPGITWETLFIKVLLIYEQEFFITNLWKITKVPTILHCTMSSGSELKTQWQPDSKIDASVLKISKVETSLQFDDKARDGYDGDEHECTAKNTVQDSPAKAPMSKESKDARKALATVYDKVLVVDNVKSARSVVQLLTSKYKNFIHACDTEVWNENPSLIDFFMSV